MHLNSYGAHLTNDGTMTATAAQDIYGAGAVVLTYGDDGLINTGSITASGAGVAGVVAWDNKIDGGLTGGFPGVIENHGSITAAGGYGVQMIGLVNWESHFTLNNSGVISGAAGADVFLFDAAGHSRAGVKADTITDFTSGLDRLNFAAIDADPLTDGDQALTFIGADGFGGVAGQVRYALGAVQVDLDGDGVADMQITLTGAPAIVANDLTL